MKLKKQKKLIGLLGLMLVLVLGGTFAYFNQTLTAENPFDTGKYDSVLTEDFNPGDGENWEPGAQVDKEVAVENTGDYPIVVRVKFEDTWADKELGDIFFTSAIGRDGTTYQKDESDGLTTGDTSVVQLLFNGTDGAAKDWTYNSTDGYWYYNKVILPAKEATAAGEQPSTGDFLKAVKLIENADMGTYKVTKYYTKAADAPGKTNIGTDPLTQWVKYAPNSQDSLDVPVPDGSLHNMTKTVQDKPGYSNAYYTLKITAQTVQATKAAAEAAFGAANVPTAWDLK